MIHLAHNGKQLGAFSEEQVRAGLRTGEYTPDMLAWKSGMSGWEPLSKVLDLTATVPATAETRPGETAAQGIDLAARTMAKLALGHDLASRWKRLAAQIVDSIALAVFMLPALAIGMAIASGTPEEPDETLTTMGVALGMIGFCVGMAIQIYLLSKRGQTYRQNCHEGADRETRGRYQSGLHKRRKRILIYLPRRPPVYP